MSKSSEELRRKLAGQEAEIPSQRDLLAKQLAAVEKKISAHARTVRSGPAKGTMPKRGMTMKPFKGGGRGKKG